MFVTDEARCLQHSAAGIRTSAKAFYLVCLNNPGLVMGYSLLQHKKP